MKNRKFPGSHPLPAKKFSICSCWDIFNVENGVDVTYAVVMDIVHTLPVVVGVTIVVVVVAVLFVAAVVVGTTLVVVVAISAPVVGFLVLVLVEVVITIKSAFVSILKRDLKIIGWIFHRTVSQIKNQFAN